MSHPGSRGFYSNVTDAEEAFIAMRKAWYGNDWRTMAHEAKKLTEVAATLATEAGEMADREQPETKGQTDNGH